MEFCKNCGALLPENAAACPVCGTAAEEKVTEEKATVGGDALAAPVAPAPTGSEAEAPAPPRPAGAPTGENDGQPQNGQPFYQQGGPAYDRAAPPQNGLSTAGYLGTLLLFMIPLVGFILMLVWSFGENVAPERQKLSRAYLLRAVILAGLGVVVALFALFCMAGFGYYGMRHGYWY